MVDDAAWQAFAVKHKLALVGCHFTDKPHDQGFLEDYANVSQGSGQALLDTLNEYASRAKHPELGARRCCCGACRQAASSITNSWPGNRSE